MKFSKNPWLSLALLFASFSVLTWFVPISPEATTRKARPIIAALNYLIEPLISVGGKNAILGLFAAAALASLWRAATWGKPKEGPGPNTRNEQASGISQRALGKRTATESNSQTDAAATFGRKRSFGLRAASDTAEAPSNLTSRLAEAVPERGSGPVPAWAILLQSPFVSWENATSWLGGRPRVPAGFDWPRGTDGKPLTFLAQIDLAAIKPHPASGDRRADIRESGAMLVFVGLDCEVRLLSSVAMQSAEPVDPPLDQPTLDELGYWLEGSAFRYWPINLLPFASLSVDGDEPADPFTFRPDVLPDRFSNPQEWISNWGIAAVDAETVITCLENEIRQAQWSADYRADKASRGETIAVHPHTGRQNAHFDMMLAEAPQLVAAMQTWRELAVAQPPLETVDRAQLSTIFEQRFHFASRMDGNYGPKLVLPGNSTKVWEKIISGAQGGDLAQFLRQIPAEYQGFVERRVTDWRSHRLFGLEPEFPNNGEDLRGWSCLISIAADEILGTQTEHDYGLSVWFKDDDLLAGRFTNGQLVRHCAV